MLQTMLNMFFGCSHRRTTFPLTLARKGAPRHNTYVVCLDCGKELDYNWNEMRVGEPVQQHVPARETAPSYR